MINRTASYITINVSVDNFVACVTILMFASILGTNTLTNAGAFFVKLIAQCLVLFIIKLSE
jgi:hypothetical protein